MVGEFHWKSYCKREVKASYDRGVNSMYVKDVANHP